MRVAAFALALTAALSPARALRADILEQAATFDPTIRLGDAATLTALPLVQVRWTATERTRTPAGDRPVVELFSVPRARLTTIARLLDVASLQLRVGARSNGDARFEQAFVALRLGDLVLAAGQFFLMLNAADDPRPQDLSAADYSTYASTFSGGQTEGAQLRLEGPVRVLGTVGNGARSGFSEFLAP
jgi:hypothetical protein